MLAKSRGNTVKFVCRQLIDDMMTGNFSSGDKLTAESLAERYKVSRTPVREALSILSRDGLLCATPNAGFSVPIMSADELLDILKIRESLESLAVFELVNNGVPDGVIDRLREYCEARKNSKDDESSMYYDSCFHMLICDSCGSRQLQQLIRNYLVLSRIFNATTEVFRKIEVKSCGRPIKENDIHKEHETIIEAIADGNAKLARKLVAAHIAAGRIKLEKIHKRAANQTETDNKKHI